MVNLVTQYNLIKDSTYARGWDGASGPYFFHMIHDGRRGSSSAEGVGIDGHSDITVESWLSETCLMSFKLELVYE